MYVVIFIRADDNIGARHAIIAVSSNYFIKSFWQFVSTFIMAKFNYCYTELSHCGSNRKRHLQAKFRGYPPGHWFWVLFDVSNFNTNIYENLMYTLRRKCTAIYFPSIHYISNKKILKNQNKERDICKIILSKKFIESYLLSCQVVYITVIKFFLHEVAVLLYWPFET